MNDLNNLRNNINLNNNNWENIQTTNCYAYAIGLDVDKTIINKYLYNPGVISNSSIILSKYIAFKYEDLLHNIISDLEYLKIKYEEINPKTPINKDEWKIAIFVKYYQFRCTNLITDYHFLRQINNLWYHKQGYNSYPTNLDCNNNIIKDIQNCNMDNYEYKTCYKLKLR